MYLRGKISLLFVAFVLIFTTMGFGSLKGYASEQGMITIKYVNENSTTLHFDLSSVGAKISTFNLSKDGETIYQANIPGFSFDYTVNSLSPNTTYDFVITGLTTQGQEYYDEQPVTTEAIPNETETVGIDQGTQTYSDSISTSPTSDDSLSYGTTGLTTDTYYDGVKRTSGWDLIGYDKFYMPNKYAMSDDGVVPPLNTATGSIQYSTGGEFKVRVKGVSTEIQGTGDLVVELYEYDSSTSKSRVKTWQIKVSTSDQDLILKNAGNYVDGSNKKAEFFVKVYAYYKPSGSYQTFNYWD